MADTLQTFASDYVAALEDYLAGRGESALRTAYELGRQALAFESGLLVVTTAHHEALSTSLLSASHEESTQIIKWATDFLTECLSPFEMAQRGFQESITSLNNLNDALHRQQQDLRLLLSPMPNLLLTVDAENCLAAYFVPPNFPHILKTSEVGMPLTQVLPDEIGTHIMLALPTVRQSAEVYRLECPLTVNGITLYFDLQISPVNDSPDVLLVIDNITQRKEIEIAEHRQRVLAEALGDTAVALSSSLDLNEVLNRIVVSIGRVVPHDTGNMMLIEGSFARTMRSFGYVEHGLVDVEKSISKLHLSPHGTPFLYKVIESKQAVIISDLTSFTEQVGHTSFGRVGSAISVPILIAGAVTGFINLNSFRVQFFTSQHAENLQTFANQAAIAIQNARLFEQAQEAAALNERHRLARDLHDSVSQSLFSASIIAESLPRIWEQYPPKALPLVFDLHQLIKSTEAEMRVLLWELRPESLVTTTLDKLLTQLVTAVKSRTTMTIECKVERLRELPEEVRIAFYRITQEALNNIVKHSRATEANIYLQGAGDKTTLRIQDNGLGFSVDDVSAGLGLGNMRERAEMIGASLELASQRGQGTEIIVAWNIPTEN
jgi:signal transduction histidine kinase